MPSEYRVAGIDVHKKMLAVVISDVAGELILSFVPAAEQRLWRTATRAPPVDLRPGAAAEPTGSLAGRCADQTEQLCQRPAWIKQPPHPAGPRTGRKRPSGVGHPGRAGSAGHPRTVMSASQKPGLQRLVWRRSRSEYVRRHGKWPTFRRMRCGEEKFLWRRQAGDFHVLVSLDLREPSKKHAI
jgi:hypothetical protein